MKALEIILMSSGITLVLFGFVHFLILDKLFKNTKYYFTMKWIVGKITLGLTVLYFGCGLAFLVKFLFQRRGK